MSLSAPQAAVRAFHERFDFEVRDTPGDPGGGILALALRLIREESAELHHACGFSAHGDDLGFPESMNVTQSAHELADLVYVTLGMAVRCGIDLGPVFDAVHAANMSKEKAFRSDGKLVKTAAYVPPDVAGILARQRPADRRKSSRSANAEEVPCPECGAANDVTDGDGVTMPGENECHECGAWFEVMEWDIVTRSLGTPDE